MIRTYHTDYSLNINDVGEIRQWTLENRQECIDRYVPGLIGMARGGTSSVSTTAMRLDAFRQFATLVDDADQLSSWAKTADAAARGGCCSALLGAAVGYGLALPVWPLALASGVIGAIVMGAYQRSELRPSAAFSWALVRMAEIAVEAQTALPDDLPALRASLQAAVALHSEAGVAMLVLAAELDRLLAEPS